MSTHILERSFKLAAFTVLLMAPLIPDALAQSARNSAKYNLADGVGLKGYDPVSYFSEGGGAPREGRENHRVEHGGVVYLFSSAENAEQFLTDPEKYEPTYGGWCAYAMAQGSQVDIDPTIFTLHGRRAHFFVSRRAKTNFDANLAQFEGQADGHWRRISGEEPRR